MDKDRIVHSFSVAKKMVEIGKDLKLSDTEIKILFIIGINHDIGYEFSENGVNHNKIGGEALEKTGFEYWKEVYYHGECDCEYESLYLKILNQADMQIDKYGNDVGYKKRLEDISNRYGTDSVVYKKCYKLINKLSG